MGKDNDLSSKQIEFWTGEMSEHLTYMHHYMNLLSIYCMLCEIKINIGDFSFPPTEEDFDALESWARCEEEADAESEAELERQHEQEMEYFFTKTEPLKEIRSLDIKNKASFTSIMKICHFLADVLKLHSHYPDVVSLRTSSYFMLYSNAAVGKVYELSGYWTAKMEERKRNMNGGAATMKEKGQKNAIAIKNIIDTLGIKSLSIFRNNKELRETFFNHAKKATCDGIPLSEDRISKIARSVLEGKAPS